MEKSRETVTWRWTEREAKRMKPIQERQKADGAE